MKLSQVKKDDITVKILSIYEKPEKALGTLRSEVAKENYLLWVAPYQATIDKLPDNMFNKQETVYTDIPDKQEWRHEFDSKVPVITTGSGYYASSLHLPLDSSLVERVTNILDDMNALLTEKTQLRDFIDESLEKVTTTKQLKALWSDYPALLTHVPADKLRKKSEQQMVLALDSELDIKAINKRLTANLLEA